jgi:hypothetical protein
MPQGHYDDGPGLEVLERLPPEFREKFSAHQRSPLWSADCMNLFRDWMIEVEKRLKALEDHERPA